MAEDVDDRYLRFALRLWDGDAMHEPLGMFWFEEMGIDDPDHIGWEMAGSYGPQAVLMQCTGLRDKRGRAIYEGDILDAWSEGSHARGVVRWGQNGGFFLAVPPPRSIWYLSGPRDPGEVLGNIYQHPHLLPAAVVPQGGEP